MIKPSATRSQRYKGFKVKHFLQLCALLALCIWLLSQLKDTCDKKGIGVFQNVMNEHGAIKLGRKDLENKETGEVEAEEESKAEESEDDRRGGDREKAEGEESEEVEVLEDLIDEEDTEV